ncbi:hypothetical protein [Glycomyces paridis]|uniref:Uncharacterized protein n=1 Tax=Glycomyces paridis TaxID=2126555 RepID=A0A4S8NYU5_9ACTN|nr:hypothetical protein [Glycomyces paridis]THV22877.1 hypothetical protein E9998_23640 [Glycomyces paridis]
MTEHRNHHGRPASRHGTLDVPLSVWQVPDAAVLTAGLLAELKPARGPIITVDVPGWEAIPKAARHALVLTRDQAASASALAGLPAAKQGLVRIQPVGDHSLGTRLAAVARQSGLVIASAWLLTCTGALAAAANALRSGGHLAVIGQGVAEQARLARLSRPRTDTDGSDEETPELLGLAFAGHVVAAPAAVFDAAVLAAEARRAGPAACPASSRHFDIVIWRKMRPAEVGGRRG